MGGEKGGAALPPPADTSESGRKNNDKEDKLFSTPRKNVFVVRKLTAQYFLPTHRAGFYTK